MPPRPSRCTTNFAKSRTAIAADPNRLAIFCPSSWHAWESAWYKQLSRGSSPPPHEVREPKTPYRPQGLTRRLGVHVCASGLVSSLTRRLASLAYSQLASCPPIICLLP